MTEYRIIRVNEDFKINNSTQSAYLFDLAVVQTNLTNHFNKSYSPQSTELFLIAKGSELAEDIFSKLNKKEYVILDLNEFEKKCFSLEEKEQPLNIHKSITKIKEEIHEFVNHEFNGKILTNYISKQKELARYAIKRINNKTAIGIILNNKFSYNYEKYNYRLDAKNSPTFINLANEKLALFFLEEIDSEIKENEDIWAKFIINGFKQEDNLFGAPINDSHSPMLVLRAFEEIEFKLRKIQSNIHNYNFEEKELGAFELKVEFLKSSENSLNDDKRVTLTSNGFSFDDITRLIQNMYNLIPTNKK